MIISEIACYSSAIKKRRTRCCGKKFFQTIFKKLSRRSSKRASVKRTNIVKLNEKVDQHSLSSWLSAGTKPSSISFVNNNVYVDPYESVYVDLSRLSGLMGSLSENEYTKWGQQGVDLFVDRQSTPQSYYVKEKRRIPKFKSNYFDRMAPSYLASDSYRRALELSRNLKYPYGCYTNSRQLYQPECDSTDSQYDDVPLVNHEFDGYHNGEEPFSPEKIRTFKIFVNLEKDNRTPTFSQVM